MTSSKLNKLSSIIHFVGIGGIGMSGIAEVMHNLGYKIQGSDLSENYNTARLKALGINIFIGHNPENIETADYVVISSAVKQDNPEVIAATANSIPVIRRSEMLAELMRFKTAIAIAGSHGKTTTTSLTACMFEAANLSPTVINGGIINNKSTNAYLGNGEYVIAEADESDGTFIKIPATVGVITNIDPEHLSYYGNFENLIAAFRQFILNLPFYGFAVACIDHPTVRALVSTITERKIITYGIDSPDAHVKAFNIKSSGFSSTYDVIISLPHSKNTLTIENITLSTPGLHNVLNSLSSIAIAAEMDFGPDVIRDAFQNFHGVKRRFTKVGEYNGALIIDDYAHHPEEVKVTLNTARDVVKARNGRVIAIFQPHRYSRLSGLFNDFVECFGAADELYILNVYSAGEAPEAGYNSQTLAEAIRKKYPSFKVSAIEDESIEDVVKLAQPNDLVLMMGAGSITYMAAKLVQQPKAVA